MVDLERRALRSPARPRPSRHCDWGRPPWPRRPCGGPRSRPIRSPWASPAAIRRRTGSCCGPAWRPTRSTAAGCHPTRWPSTWEVASRRRLRDRRGRRVGQRRRRPRPHGPRRGRRPRSRTPSYWYRFAVEGWVSPVGRAAHARRSGRPTALRFGFVSCQNYASGYYPALAGAGRRRSATCGCTSATTSTRTPAAARPARTVPTSASRSTQYRDRYAPLQDRSRPPGGPPRRAGRPGVGRPRGRQQLHRRGRRPAHGRVPRLVRAPAGAPDRARRARALQIYRRLAWGDLAAFHMLDVRQYRDPAPCGGGLADCPERLGEDRTLLGCRAAGVARGRAWRRPTRSGT